MKRTIFTTAALLIASTAFAKAPRSNEQLFRALGNAFPAAWNEQKIIVNHLICEAGSGGGRCESEEGVIEHGEQLVALFDALRDSGLIENCYEGELKPVLFLDKISCERLAPAPGVEKYKCRALSTHLFLE